MSAPKLIVGNWKMNGLTADSKQRVDALMAAKSAAFNMVLCPPATLINALNWWTKDSALKIGGQDCHAQASGAFTGNISAQMLKDLGCTHVIVGHSERRQYHKETSAEVAAKAKAAHEAGLIAIICIGETDAERTAGRANDVVSEQLAASVPDCATVDNTVIAYEPVWAIGTGKVASSDDIKGIHALIREKSVVKAQILYGGSVKGSNAAEILHLPNVDGVLVGGASLKADEFLAIANAA
ncbi:MAG: triose-phosphate isomerase [bacterium]|nr:triose-phosphate isomerase [bacterium]